MKRFNRNNTKTGKSKHKQHDNAKTVNKRDEGGIYLGSQRIDGAKIKKINKKERPETLKTTMKEK